MNFTRFLIVISAVCVINHQPPANAQMAGTGAGAGAGTRAAAPRRINFNEAQRMLGNQTEGNLGNQPNRFSRTRLSTGQVLEIYYPISVRSSGKIPKHRRAWIWSSLRIGACDEGECASSSRS
ncbi:MAG: hypothetical protein IPJ07_18260 [Acidobacteria bacterium]|nr:hypothetical protein [Acidobacteriota bacterium]